MVYMAKEKKRERERERENRIKAGIASTNYLLWPIGQ
jgi:hypothetical protein